MKDFFAKTITAWREKMKIGEAWQKYSSLTNELWEEKNVLLKQQKELQETNTNEEELESVKLKLNDVGTKYDAVNEFMLKLMDIKNTIYNAEVEKQQSDAVGEAFADIYKCIEIARRIASGSKVPTSDAKKLMEYNPQLYMQAINAATMNKHKENKEYDSLWDEENNETEDNNIEEEVNDRECTIEEPLM